MVKTIGEKEFIDEFEKMGRKENFSQEGKKALFEYFEEYEEGTGQQEELDIIAICCDYTEYKNIKEFWNDYGKELYPTINDIEFVTTVIKIDEESFIIQQF
jgi:hypothetical protein